MVIISTPDTTTIYYSHQIKTLYKIKVVIDNDLFINVTGFEMVVVCNEIEIHSKL